MSKAEQPTELERALVRADIDALRSTLDEYFVCVKHPGGPSDPDGPGMPDKIIDTHDVDTCLALVALAEAEYDDADFLGHVAAEPLENIFVIGGDDSETTIERIEREAGRSARFRWMLRGIYTGFKISDVAEARIKAAAGQRTGDDDPLPPRPFA